LVGALGLLLLLRIWMVLAGFAQPQFRPMVIEAMRLAAFAVGHRRLDKGKA
jgi:hypothetical protein